MLQDNFTINLIDIQDAVVNKVESNENRVKIHICDCCKKKFYEKLHIVPKFHRITNGVALFLLKRLKSRISIKYVANELNVSMCTNRCKK